MLATSVAQLLAHYGSDLVLTRPGTPTYDPATGALSASAPSLISIRGVFVSYKDDAVDGTVVRSGDRRLLMQASDAPTDPRVGDQVAGMKIMDVRTIAPRGVAVAYSCQARK